MEILGTYKNGNTRVVIFEDGTRIVTSKDNEFDFAFPMNIDVTITTKCDGGCGFCYMNCTEKGIHANLNQPWVDTIRPYTEVAINGNDLTHPGLIEFLTKLNKNQVIANMTINQKHFMQHIDFVQKLVNNNLIKGLGISLVSPTEEFITEVKKFPNAIIHVINGVFTPEDAEALSNHGLKLLILGYKHLRRGQDYYDYHETEIVENQTWLLNHIEKLLYKFNVISFDNLALKQLPVVKKDLLTNEEWEEFYAGDDGTCSMYIDMVKGIFARSSTTQLETMLPLMDNLDDMFKIVKENNKQH